MPMDRARHCRATCVLPPEAFEHVRKRIRDAGYDGLKNGQWVKVLGFKQPMNTILMDNLEKMIEIFGQYIPLSNRRELQIALATYETFEMHLPRDPFLHCLAETALNQVLDERKIGRIEMNRIQTPMDEELAAQNRNIAQVVREKIGRVLQGGC